MVNILSKNDEDSLIDVMRIWNGGKSPVTFGDSGIDDEGNEYPLEKELVKHEDYCTQQSLDYIFEIKRAFQRPKNMNSDSSSKEEGPDGKPIQRLEIQIQESQVEKFFFSEHHTVK